MDNGYEMNAGTPTDPTATTRPNPNIEWTLRDVEIFTDIWAGMISSCNDDIGEVGKKFFIWMLDNVPNMRSRFGFGPMTTAEDLAQNNKFVSHVQTLSASLDRIVKSLLEPDEFDAAIREMVNVYLSLKPPVNNEQFETLRDTVKDFVMDVTGEDETSQTASMWFQLMEVIVKIHAEEQGKMGDQGKEKSGCCVII